MSFIEKCRYLEACIATIEQDTLYVHRVIHTLQCHNMRRPADQLSDNCREIAKATAELRRMLNMPLTEVDNENDNYSQ